MEKIIVRGSGTDFVYEGVSESGGTFTYGERGTAEEARKAARDARIFRGIQTGTLPKIEDKTGEDS